MEETIRIKFEAKMFKRPSGLMASLPEFRARVKMAIYKPSQPNKRFEGIGEWFYFTLENGWEAKFVSAYLDWKTLGQFIGLYDQEKKKIYGGDKLEIGEHPDFRCDVVKEKLIGMVEYWEIFGAWHFVYGKKGKGLQILQAEHQIQDLSICADRSKVIGNIYDNPELKGE